MSIPIFPSLPGLTWPIKVSPTWSTLKQKAISGRETRLAQWSTPLRHYELAYDLLRQSPGFQEWQTLTGFYNAMQGSAGLFQFTDPNDGAAAGQGFGTGDGTTSSFQLVRSLGGFTEPVFAIAGTPSILLNGEAIPATGLSAPGVPTLGSVAGGALAGTTYYGMVSWVTAAGESAVSGETDLGVASGNLLTIAAPASPPAGAIGWNVYVSGGVGGFGQETRQNGATPIALGTGWTEPEDGLVAGLAPPAANETGWTLGTTGMVTFATAPSPGTALTWTGSYNWLCRFDEDNAEFGNVASGLWEIQKLAFTSVKL